MSCNRDAAHCNRIAGAHGAPEAVAVWSAGRESTGHCERCGGFLDSEGMCHNPRCGVMTATLAGGSILGVVDTGAKEEAPGICPHCGTVLSVEAGEDWCTECMELVMVTPSKAVEQIRLLGDEDENVRKEAAIAPGKIGDPAAVPALIEALNHNDVNIQRASAEAFGAMFRAGKGTADIRQSVVNIIQNNISTASITALALWMHTLKHFDISLSMPIFTRVLERHARYDARLMIVATLSELSDPSAIPALTKALSDKSKRVQVAAQVALDELRGIRV